MLLEQGRVLREAWVRQGQQPAETFKEAILSNEGLLCTMPSGAEQGVGSSPAVFDQLDSC